MTASSMPSVRLPGRILTLIIPLLPRRSTAGSLTLRGTAFSCCACRRGRRFLRNCVTLTSTPWLKVGAGCSSGGQALTATRCFCTCRWCLLTRFLLSGCPPPRMPILSTSSRIALVMPATMVRKIFCGFLTRTWRPSLTVASSLSLGRWSMVSRHSISSVPDRAARRPGEGMRLAH